MSCRALASSLCVWLFVLAGLAHASDYVGSGACAPCHQAEYERQSQSHHALALRPIKDSALAGALLQVGQSPDHQLRYAAADGGVLVRETGEPETSLLEWAFGAGVQGVTPVGRLGGQFIEHQFSFYSETRALAPTFGHPLRPVSPIAEMGVLQDGNTISHCFSCHATAVTAGASGPELAGMEPGVQCERCHGPGSAHMEQAKRGATVEAIRREVINPGRLPAKAQIPLCGQCHRLPGPDLGDQPELEDPVTVRFAPVGLLASRCFRESKNLSCLTCHDPHANTQPRTDLSYSRKCLECHTGDRRPVRLCKRRTERNCLPCHMRQVALGPYLRFTDHRIRVGE